MNQNQLFSTLALLLLIAGLASAVDPRTFPNGPRCVQWANSPNQPPATGTWSYVAKVAPHCREMIYGGARGWYLNGSQTDLTQPNGEYIRIKQAFLNIKTVVEEHGATLRDITFLHVACNDLVRCRPIVNQVQIELWGPINHANPNHPPRGIFGDITFNGLDCLRPDGTYYRGVAGPTNQVVCQPGDKGIGDIIEISPRFAVPLLNSLP